MGTSTSWIAERRKRKAEAAEVMKAQAAKAKAKLEAYREARRTGQPVVTPTPELGDALPEEHGVAEGQAENLDAGDQGDDPGTSEEASDNESE
ncbi:hypothetical protein FDJ43_gp07 [Microbacterium phage Koji]|uniref:Uncharacterized protein n=1 Tax=Microbacterium phage Koji TaxID=2099625 RepID=A0A2P1CFA7_9CAUD|nr:hypothetical protein FDJ43_gp07 [Microbacterium phage Koji]AVJ49908.1 hypothetical protein PBI_KOJI_7 [Microbacterium phage Koji]